MRELQNCRGVIDNSCQRKYVTNLRLQTLPKTTAPFETTDFAPGRSNSSKKTGRGTFGHPLASKVTRCWERQRPAVGRGVGHKDTRESGP